MTKDTKKMIYLQEKPFIDAVTNDESEVEKRPASGVIERHLLESILPANRQAAAIVRSIYYDGIPDLHRAFCGTFEYLAAGINWQAAEPNARPLVQLYHDCLIHSAPPTGTELGWEYMAQQLDSIATKLETAANQNPDHRQDQREDGAFIREIIGQIAAGQAANVRFISVTRVLLSHWELLGNFTRTFRFLAEVSKTIKGITDTAQTRVEFIRIIKEVSREW